MYILHRRRQWGQKDIANLFGCDISTVCRHIQQSAVNRGEVVTGMYMLQPDGSTAVLTGRELFRELYLGQNMGVNGIADALLCSAGTAWNRLRQYKIPPKPRGNPNFKKQYANENR